MNAREVSTHLGVDVGSRRSKIRGGWKALCPAHKDSTPSLDITEGKKGVMLTCQSHHCNFFDIVRAAGLKPEMLFFDWSPTNQVDRKALAEAHRKREADEKRARDIRIGQWCVRFIRQGYTQEDEDSDVASIVACCMVLSQKQVTHWEGILRTHLERIEAAMYCMESGMLPKTATPRWQL